jgi:hypothetical protein
VARLAEAAKGAQVNIQIGRGEAKLFGHVADFSRKLHQRFTHPLDLFLAECAPFHSADRSAFEQLPQEIDQSKSEIGETKARSRQKAGALGLETIGTSTEVFSGPVPQEIRSQAGRETMFLCLFSGP